MKGPPLPHEFLTKAIGPGAVLSVRASTEFAGGAVLYIALFAYLDAHNFQSWVVWLGPLVPGIAFPFTVHVLTQKYDDRAASKKSHHAHIIRDGLEPGVHRASARAKEALKDLVKSINQAGTINMQFALEPLVEPTETWAWLTQHDSRVPQALDAAEASRKAFVEAYDQKTRALVHRLAPQELRDDTDNPHGLQRGGYLATLAAYVLVSEKITEGERRARFGLGTATSSPFRLQGGPVESVVGAGAYNLAQGATSPVGQFHRALWGAFDGGEVGRLVSELENRHKTVREDAAALERVLLTIKSSGRLGGLCRGCPKRVRP